MPLEPLSDAEKLDIKGKIRLQRRASLFMVVVGSILLAMGTAVGKGDRSISSDSRSLGYLFALVGVLLLIEGMAVASVSKGRSAWWGLVGLLTWPGLVVVHCLGKNCMRCGSPGGSSAKQCDRCGGPL